MADVSHTDEFNRMYQEMVKQAEDKYKVKSEHPKTEEEDLIPKFGEYSDNEPLDVSTMTTDFVKEHGFPCPTGYIFKDENGNVINATKIVLEKKEKEYPNSYSKCCDILGCPFLYSMNTHRHAKELQSLYMLLICRDAYWKIAGEEMGLGKPWEPDYDSGVDKFGIICLNGVVQESNPTTNWERHLNKVLDFPTREMRDAFKDNFKKLINECKELL